MNGNALHFSVGAIQESPVNRENLKNATPYGVAFFGYSSVYNLSKVQRMGLVSIYFRYHIVIFLISNDVVVIAPLPYGNVTIMQMNCFGCVHLDVSNQF